MLAPLVAGGPVALLKLLPQPLIAHRNVAAHDHVQHVIVRNPELP